MSPAYYIVIYIWRSIIKANIGYAYNFAIVK